MALHKALGICPFPEMGVSREISGKLGVYSWEACKDLSKC